MNAEKRRFFSLESALEIFQKAEAFRRSKGGVHEIRIAIWCVARTLRSLRRVEEALSKQLGLLKDYESVGASDGYVFEELGECLLALERTQEAWLTEKEPERLARLKEMAN